MSQNHIRLSCLVVVVFAACNCRGSSSGPGASAGRQPTESPLAYDVADSDPRESVLAKSIERLLESEHLLRTKIDDSLSRKAFAEYVEALDPGKMFLLANDVEALRAYEMRMDDEMRAGKLVLPHVGHAILRNRRQEVAAMIQEILATPFNFSVDEAIESDEEKVAHARNDEELRDRWRKTLKWQALERIDRMERTREVLAKANGDADAAKKQLKKDGDLDAGVIPPSMKEIPEDFVGQEKKARADLAKSYTGRFRRLIETEPLESVETYFNAIAAAYDPHTVYLAPAEKENFDIQMSGTLEGIGAELREDDTYIRVQSVIPGGASWRQGRLEAGDLILSVAQQGEEAVDIADMRINQVVGMVRGPAGTTVTLTVRKSDDSIESISIVRDVVVIEDSYARGAILRRGKNAVGYIWLPSFYGDPRTLRGSSRGERKSSDDVRRLVEKLVKRNVGSLIFDLRGNGGGLLDHARDVAGLFIKSGPIVQTRYPDGELQVLRDEDPSLAFAGEVVVLVDRFSASASEIVAAALQDYGRALVVGTGPTHGKGTVQMLVDLNQLAPSAAQGRANMYGVLKLTIQQFFGVDGESTQWRGVVPDVVLPDPLAHIESGERSLDNSIPWSKIKNLSHQPWPGRRWSIADLNKRTQARVGASKWFQRIRERSEYLAKRREDTLVPLKRDLWVKRRETEKAALEGVDPKLEERNGVTVEVVADDLRGSNSTDPDTLKTWREDLSHDPWVEEATFLLEDMNDGKARVAGQN